MNSDAPTSIAHLSENITSTLENLLGLQTGRYTHGDLIGSR